MTFFNSQVVYNSDNAISLLRDYQKLLEKRVENNDIPSEALTTTNNPTNYPPMPSRIIFTFAPLSRKQTADFLRWLGVEVPIGTERRILSELSLSGRASESVSVCVENFAKILNYARRKQISIPISFNVESVSMYKTDFKATKELVLALNKELERHNNQL